jgi:hypothetical protein
MLDETPAGSDERTTGDRTSAYVTEYTSRVWIDTVVKEEDAFLHCM